MKKERKAHIFEKDAFEFYLESAWCPRAILQQLQPEGDIYDPFAGTGRVLMAAEELGYKTSGAEITAPGWRPKFCKGRIDYSTDSIKSPIPEKVDNVVSNPPYDPAKEVVDVWLPRVRNNLVLLLPADWFYSVKRVEWLEATPLIGVYALVPRPSMPPGEIALEVEAKTGRSPQGGTKNYAYYHWKVGAKYDPKMHLLSAKRVGTVAAAFS